MLEVKDLWSRSASAVIHDSFGEDTDQRAFAAIYVSDHCNANIVFFPDSKGTWQAVKLLFETFPFFLFL